MTNITLSIDDEIYKAAKQFYMPQLTETKGLYYINALKTLLDTEKLKVPKDASKELQGAIEKIKLAHNVEKLLETDKLDEAQELIEGNVGYDSVTGARMSVAALHSGPAYINTRKKILMDIAKVQYNIATQTMEAKKLYDTVDQIIDTSQYGKAVALTSMYNSHKLQQKINEKKAEDAKKLKK